MDILICTISRIFFISQEPSFVFLGTMVPLMRMSAEEDSWKVWACYSKRTIKSWISENGFGSKKEKSSLALPLKPNRSSNRKSDTALGVLLWPSQSALSPSSHCCVTVTDLTSGSLWLQGGFGDGELRRRWRSWGGEDEE